jgi:hypothetical protein
VSEANRVATPKALLTNGLDTKYSRSGEAGPDSALIGVEHNWQIDIGVPLIGSEPSCPFVRTADLPYPPRTPHCVH